VIGAALIIGCGRLTTGGEPPVIASRFCLPIAGSRFAWRRPVLCRIDCRRENARLVVRLAGRLGDAHVPDLLAACAQPTQTDLELDELVSADAVGVDALQRIEQQGARLVGLPQYLRLHLDVLGGERRR
jgi:hypothetical protein